MKYENKQERIVSQRHPLGFTILQNKEEKYKEIDAQHIFLNGHKLIYSESLETLKGVKAKKMNGLKRNARMGSAILKRIGFASRELLANPRFEECYFKVEGDYLLATQSGKKEFRGGRFNVFVTNGCLFGTHLQGIQQDGKRIPLVDHHLDIQSPIVDIAVEHKFHPYEKTVFKNFSKQLRLIKKMGADNFKVFYHLPVMDYTLPAVRLLIHGKISDFALREDIKQIQIRGYRHKRILKWIAKKQHVHVKFISPFENIADPRIELTAEKLLSALDLGQIIERCSAPEVERAFVKKILHLLSNNHYFPEIQAIWRTLEKKYSNFESVTCLEDLLRMANAAVIAYGVEKNHGEDYSACAWLSADEYPVYNHYRLKMSQLFGDVVCFSILPSTLNYVGMQADGVSQQSLFRCVTEGDVSESPTQFTERNTLFFNADYYYLGGTYRQYFISLSHGLPIERKKVFSGDKSIKSMDCSVAKNRFLFFYKRNHQEHSGVHVRQARVTGYGL